MQHGATVSLDQDPVPEALIFADCFVEVVEQSSENIVVRVDVRLFRAIKACLESSEERTTIWGLWHISK